MVIINFLKRLVRKKWFLITAPAVVIGLVAWGVASEAWDDARRGPREVLVRVSVDTATAQQIIEDGREPAVPPNGFPVYVGLKPSLTVNLTAEPGETPEPRYDVYVRPDDLLTFTQNILAENY